MASSGKYRSLARAGTLFLVLLVVPDTFGGATVEGIVDLGDPPRRQRAVKRYGAASSDSVGATQRPPAVVYLEGNFADVPRRVGAEPPRMLQKDLQFYPLVLPVRVGTTVEFPNQDAVYHNVFSYASAKSFDLGRYRGTDGAPAVTFDEPGVVSVFCEIHSHMRSVILVLESPYFVVTDTNGAFKLENLPAGNFVLKAWVNPKTVFSREVALQDGVNLKIDFPKP